jgi:hypothetical protein
MRRISTTRKAPPGVASSASAAPPGPFFPSYLPSGINRFVDRLERLPGPAWVYYSAAALGLTLMPGWRRYSSRKLSVASRRSGPSQKGPYRRGTVMAKKSARSIQAEPAVFVPPYSPSWVDWLTRLVDRLPGPAWAVYLLAGVPFVVVGVVVQASQGAYALSGIPPAHIFIFLQPVMALALIHYLDRFATHSFDRIRPALRLEDIDAREVHWRLTTLPPRATWLASLLGLLVAPILVAVTPNWAPLFAVAPTTFSFAQFSAFIGLIWFVLGPLIYHTIHQLAWVRAIHARYVVVDPYHLEPLYVFSGLTARTALALLAIDYAWVFAYTSPLTNSANIVLSVSFAALAAIVFAWPLWGVHRLLAEEKAHLLTDCARRMKAAIAELRRRIDSGQLKAMDDLNKTMASLEIEHASLARIPTWPWPPGTLRGVVAAVLLPVAIWLIQQVLQPLLAR